ncbi:MAG: hypothetical protein N2484_18615 [Clostridia bacterium]|nr:hypothetical protein [Clostridia bacterium]
MKCEFCGFEFNEHESRSGCSGCPMSKSCNKLKCPNCNYEMVPVSEIRLLDNIKKWGKIIWNKKAKTSA